MPLQVVRNDITKIKADAIVNAANSALQMGGGVCGQIFAAAGVQALQAECDKIGNCDVGQAVITKAYNLSAKYIIHTVGPVWHGGDRSEARLLYNCYINSLALAVENKCSSIAFPLISSGAYGCPKDQALQIAISAIGQFLLRHEILVYLVVFDKASFTISEKLFTAIENYIDDHYAETYEPEERRRRIEYCQSCEPEEPHEMMNLPKPLFLRSEAAAPSSGKRKLEDVMAQLDETFSERLLRLIDEKGMSDVQAYKRANVDRKLFSKIRSNKNYNPSKATAIAFAIALELSLDETRDLLNKAGYSLSHSSKFDVIIEFFIQEANYNIHEINEALFAFDQLLLGA